MQSKALVLTNRPLNVSKTYIQHIRNSHVVAKDWSPVSSMWEFLNYIMAHKKFNVLDLFCGCGGLSKGFEEAGYNILIGVDFEQSALNTFNLNHEGAEGVCLDLSQKESFDKIDELLNGRKLDVIIGGPPCQGFSLTGPRNFDDERNKLYLAMIETVRRYKPQAFLIENGCHKPNIFDLKQTFIYSESGGDKCSSPLFYV